MASIDQISLGISEKNISVYMVTWSEPVFSGKNVVFSFKKEGDTLWSNTLAVIPFNGIPEGGSFVVITDATPGVKYQVRAYIENEGTSAETTISMPNEISGNYYLVADAIYNLCGSSPVFLYSKNPFSEGVTLFVDAFFTTSVVGEYVSMVSTGKIYSLASGVVGSSTNYSCLGAIEGLFVVGNTESLCDGSFGRYYTNAVNAETISGYSVFLDQELINPVTGFSFILNSANGIVYEISGAGLVGDAVGVCEDFYNLIVRNNNSKRTITGVFGIDKYLLPSPVSVGQFIYGVHSEFEGKISIALNGGGNCDSCGTDNAKLYVNGTLVQTIFVQDGVYFFDSISYSGGDVIVIESNEIVCDSSPLVIS